MVTIVPDMQHSRNIDPFSLEHREPYLFISSQAFSTSTLAVWCTAWTLWHAVWLCLDPFFLHEQRLLPDKEWFFQLTHVGYIILTLYSMLDCLSVFRYIGAGKENTRMDPVLKLTWFFYIIAISTAPAITLLYFILHKLDVQANSLNFHVMNSVYTIQNVLTGRKPLRCHHVIFPMLFGALYVLTTAIYQSSTGTVLYESLDWTKTFSTMALSIGIVFIVAPMIFFVMCVITWLRNRMEKDQRKSNTHSPCDTETAGFLAGSNL